MNTSFSALDTFRSCPLKYKRQQIDKIRTPKSPEAVFGTLMHDTMKFIHTGGFTLPTQKEALHHFSSRWNSEIFGDDEIKERTAFAQGINIIQNYYKKNDPNQFQIVALESRFTIEIEDKEKSQIHLVSGFIDRIDKTEDGFEIIDYKTSRKLPPQKTVDDNLQLLIYLFAFLHRYPKEENIGKIKLSLYFLKHGTKLSAEKNEEQLAAGRKEVLGIIDEIENSDFPPTVTPLCDWCGYQKMCPMWKHKFKEERKTDAEKEKIVDEYVGLDESNKKNRKKMGELKQQIMEVMETEEAERLFGKDKIVSKTHRQNFKYDEGKLKQLLEKLDKWDDAVKVDGVKLRKILETLPVDKKREIEDTKELKSESWGLSVKKQ